MQQQQPEVEGSNGAHQRPRNARSRISAGKKRPWYGRALDCLHLWMQPAVVPPPPPVAEDEEESPHCRSSLKAAALAFARFLRLFAPACSHEAVLRLGLHVDAAAPTPRRSGSCSAGGVSSASAVPAPTRPSAVPAWEGTPRSRAPCRGRLLTDGACTPMRRFVLDELARRREEMEAVHVKIRRSRDEWQPPGNSRLRRMSLAE